MEPRYWYGLEKSINPLGFGCWQLSGEYFINAKPQGWGTINTKDALRLIHYALDEGIQFFDTAAAYGNGKSEEIVGSAISSSSAKNSAVICTKISLTVNEENSNELEQSFVGRVEESLKRLKRDRIDVLLIHDPPDAFQWDKLDIKILDDLRLKGLIGTYGVSCKSLKGAKNVIACEFGTCLEWVFNLLERRPTVEIFPKIKEVKMNFIARSPLSRGLLSSKYLRNEPAFDENHFRSTLPADWVKWTIDSIRKIEKFSSAPFNLPDVAIKYCLSFNEMSVVIPGIHNKDHLQDFIRIVKEEKLKKEFVEYLEKMTESHYPKWA